eukprot:gene29646-36388_t
MRASSPTLSSAFGDGVLAQGLDVVYIGLASTDELYFASGLLNCPGAMFTVVSGVPAYDGPAGTASTKDVLEEYASYLRGLVDLAALRPLKVAVDAGNGMGGHTAPAVFGPMPLDAYVRETGADIGLAFDGDADRCFVVDEKGDPVSPSAVTALVAKRELAKEPGASIIHNLITSRA